VQAPLDVTVLRSGIPDTVPGRSVNLCERGLGAMLAAEVLPGETVGVEVFLPRALDPLRTRALVRYQDKLRCGMEFVGLSEGQRTTIRQWASLLKAEAEADAPPKSPAAETRNTGGGKGSESSGGGPPVPPRPRRGKARWVLLLVAALVAAAAVFWWRWNRAWQELEAGLPDHEAVSAEKAQLQVPTEVMQGLLVHKVDPVYPAQARKDKIQGVIVLDIVVGRDGSVVDMRPQNGPDVLAHAAMEAVRWWKFEPYRLNGEPAAVGTRIAIKFKP
jgi:TonB family protein